MGLWAPRTLNGGLGASSTTNDATGPPASTAKMSWTSVRDYGITQVRGGFLGAPAARHVIGWAPKNDVQGWLNTSPNEGCAGPATSPRSPRALHEPRGHRRWAITSRADRHHIAAAEPADGAAVRQEPAPGRHRWPPSPAWPSASATSISDGAPGSGPAAAAGRATGGYATASGLHTGAAPTAPGDLVVVGPMPAALQDSHDRASARGPSDLRGEAWWRQEQAHGRALDTNPGVPPEEQCCRSARRGRRSPAGGHARSRSPCRPGCDQRVPAPAACPTCGDAVNWINPDPATWSSPVRVCAARRPPG